MSVPQRAQSPARTRPALLQTPLYAFDLPPALRASLVVRAADDETPAPSAPSAPKAAQSAATPAAGSVGVPACSLCPGCSSFRSVAEQRSHVRSLWHRFNLVLRQHAARGAQGTLELVSHEQLEQMCASLDHPNDDDDEDMDELSALLQQLDVREGTGDDEAARTVKSVQDALRSPLVWYETPAQAQTVLEQTQLGLYRDILLAAAGSAAADDARVPSLDVLAAPRLEVRPGTHGWAGKRVQGTHQVSRMMQMQVLDGAALVPWLTPEDVALSDDDTMSSSSETETSEDNEDQTVPSAPLPPLRLWTFIMMGGGYFAAATVALNVHSPPLSDRARARGTKPTRSVLMLAHKTFQRYTTRRKQGGAQSMQDASGRHAKSAGANLRRYGEAQLKADIHDLLDRRAWRELIQRSEHVWVRTSMRAAHGVLWQWPGHATSPLDEKQANGTLSHIPIATQRPTLSEIVRVFWELTRVKVAHLSSAELAAQDEAHRDAIARALRQNAAQHGPKAPPPAPPKAPQVKKDEREARHRARLERLVAMVRKGRLDALAQWLVRHEAMLGQDAGAVPPAYEHAAPIDRPLPAWWRASEARGAAQAPINLLQVAAAADQVEILHYLLVEHRADPTLPLSRDDGAHRTAYDLCGSKSARAVFRRLMAEQPDWYRWDEMGPGGARVPSALTADMEEAQASKARSRRAAMREKMRERDAKVQADADNATTTAPAAAPAAAAPKSGPQRLGGAGAAPDASLSEEMQRRIEREKRARAAEARMLRK